MKNKKLFYILLTIFLVSAWIMVFLSFLSKSKPQENLNCITSVEERTVRGDSLEGIVASGQTVNVFFGYYQCNQPDKGDLVLVYYAGNDNPILKIIKAVPGDQFSLAKAGGGWNILVNGSKLKNSENKEYVINGQKSQMLSLYVESYNNVIPADAYLVLGNLIKGSIDSTTFGLVSRNDIIGKVEIK
jgi:signal peptidase I